MKNARFFERIRAAQNLSNAFDNGRAPQSSDLKTLGLPASCKSSFKR